MKTSKLIAIVLLSAAAGAVAGLLMAPESGAETRKKIKKRAQQFGDMVKDKMDEFSDTISQKYASVRKEAEDILEKNG